MKEIGIRFSIDHTVIYKAMRELQRQNLVDILYKAPPQKDKRYQYSYINTYIVQPLYDPEKLEEEWDKLAVQYGEEQFQKAMTYAEIVCKENDARIVKDIIEMINKYGEAIVDRAFPLAP